MRRVKTVESFYNLLVIYSILSVLLRIRNHTASNVSNNTEYSSHPYKYITAYNEIFTLILEHKILIRADL